MHGEFIFGLLLFSLMLWAMGESLIKSFFKRKEEMIQKMMVQHEKGDV